MVLEISLTKKCYRITEGQMDGWKEGQMWTSITPTVSKRGEKYIIINLHTKYDYSSLHSFTEIFDKKFHYSKLGKKENWTNTGKNKHEKAGSQSHNTIHHYQPAYQIWLQACTISQKSLTKNFINSKYGKKENWTNTGKNYNCQKIWLYPFFNAGV